MKINPTKLFWTAPTTNEDGTPITYKLQYELGIYTDRGIEPLMTVPSKLQIDEGKYEAPIEDVGFGKGIHVVALRSFAKENANRVSVWSDTVEFAISDEVPDAPFGFGVY